MADVLLSFLDANNNPVHVSATNPVPISATGGADSSEGADGAAAPTKTQQIGGNDGTNLQAVLVDTGGRIIVIGAAADNAAAVGNPMQVGAKYDAAYTAPDDGDVYTLRTNVAGGLYVGGRYADDAAMGGATNYPLSVGGQYNSTFPTYTAGDRTQLQQDSRGNIKVSLCVLDTASGIGIGVDNADTLAGSSTNGFRVMAREFQLNGAGSWNRKRDNSEWETVAASQTDQALGATGATGDYLSALVIIPATTSPGAVSIKDGAGSAITVFTGGATSVLDLAPILIQFGANGMKSAAGAWKVTTGASVSAIGIGTFT